ncbi:MAG: hypothetical protein KDN22_04415, partial [Verrucomicrobiae bacterium]|nr:hypothetical protein [Verrucomicrobiae bacterium]
MVTLPGYITSGLSPNKKRLALLDAQRQRDSSAESIAPERSEPVTSIALAISDLGFFFGSSGYLM